MLCRLKTVAGAQLRLDITIISRVHNQGRDYWKLGSGQDEPPWPGAQNQLASYPSLVLMRNHNTVCLLPLLDRIPFNHWNLFYHQDAPSPLQARRAGDSKSGSVPALLRVSSSIPIAHATVRILSGKNASHPFLPRFSVARMLSSSSSTSISPRCCVLLTAGGRSFARAHLSTTTKQRITVLWWSEQDRPRVQLRGLCGLERSCLGFHRRTRPAIGVSFQ